MVVRVACEISLTRRTRRNLAKHLRRLDWKVERMKRKMQRILKGMGDYIGMALMALGGIGAIGCALAADGIPNIYMDRWLYAEVISCLLIVLGGGLLYLMREA